jgi:hypothetical protein
LSPAFSLSLFLTALLTPGRYKEFAASGGIISSLLTVGTFLLPCEIMYNASEWNVRR